MVNKQLDLQTNRYQNSLVYIMLVLLLVLYIGAAIIARLCYLPYSMNISVLSTSHKLLWSFLILPSIVIPVSLCMANIINKKLKNLTILFIFISCAFFAFVPLIYSLGEYNTVSYITSPFAIYLISLSSSFVIWDIRKSRVSKHRIIFTVITLFVFILFLLLAYILVNYTVITDFLSRIVICYLMPPMVLMTFLMALISVFSGSLSKATVIFNFVITGYAVLCVAFSFMNHRPLHILLTVGVFVELVLIILDIKKYIFLRGNKNDSEFSNA